MILTVGLALAGVLIIIVGIGRLANTAPDILVPGMEPSRWRQALNDLVIMWIGLGLASLAAASHAITWYTVAGLVVWAALGALLGRRLWTAHRDNQTNQ